MQHTYVPFKRITIGVLLVACLTVPLLAFAQPAVPATTLPPPLPGAANLSVFVSWVLRIVLTILWPAIVVLLVATGLMFVTAQGNEQKLTQAKNALWWALVGTAIAAGAQVLKVVIEGTIAQL